MLAPELHAQRRQTLQQKVGRPILLMANVAQARNLPMNVLPFRQDSSFLYFTGCHTAGAALLIDDSGETLFLPEVAEDDALWHGPLPGIEEQAEALGFSSVAPRSELEARLQGTQPATLAIADAAVNSWLTRLTGEPHVFGRQFGDRALVRAIIDMRKVKDEHEIAEMRAVTEVSAQAHALMMKLTRPGRTEQGLAEVFRSFLRRRGYNLGYDVILSQDGQILHNHDHSGVLTPGRMVLLDGGGEHIGSAYGADITRTWPVSGTFNPQQKAAYQAVLAAQEAQIAKCTVGTSFREVHDAGCLVIAQFLIDEGLLTGITAEDAVATGAHALFFPHGTGHHLGMDVHDLENFGDLSSYPEGMGRPELFGTRYLRLHLPLEAGWVVTVEPGFYVVPAILNDATLRDRFSKVLNADALAGWEGFGGIRIEDDILITPAGPDNLSASAPKTVAEIEALVGTDADLNQLLL